MSQIGSYPDGCRLPDQSEDCESVTGRKKMPTTTKGRPVHLRPDADQRAHWQEAAERLGLTVSAWARETLDAAAAEQLAGKIPAWLRARMAGK